MMRMIRLFSVSTLVCLMTTLSYAEELKIGDQAPTFKADNIDGSQITLEHCKDAKVVVVCFTCNKCPVAIAYEDRMIQFANQFKDKGVKFVAINCNHGEDLEAMKTRAEEKGFGFPYAYDESGQSARDYGAKVTPHFFVLDEQRKVAYIGALDDNMKNPSETYLVNAVNEILEGKTPTVAETKPVGCRIKLKQ